MRAGRRGAPRRTSGCCGTRTPRAGSSCSARFTILVGWMIASLIILGVQQGIRKDPEGTVSWFGLLATNLSLIVLIPLSMLVARKLNRQTPGAVVLGGRPAALAAAGVVRAWPPWRSSW